MTQTPAPTPEEYLTFQNKRVLLSLREAAMRRVRVPRAAAGRRGCAHRPCQHSPIQDLRRLMLMSVRLVVQKLPSLEALDAVTYDTPQIL